MRTQARPFILALWTAFKEMFPFPSFGIWNSREALLAGHKLGCIGKDDAAVLGFDAVNLVRGSRSVCLIQMVKAADLL